MNICLFSCVLYIYIYCHLHIYCFLVLQLISVARYTRCFKLGSKPGWISYCTATSKLSISEGILTHIYHFSFVYIYVLNGYQVHSSLEDLCIMRVVTSNPFTKVFNIYIYIYIYIYIIIVLVAQSSLTLFYHLSLSYITPDRSFRRHLVSSQS